MCNQQIIPTIRRRIEPIPAHMIDLDDLIFNDFEEDDLLTRLDDILFSYKNDPKIEGFFRLSVFTVNNCIYFLSFNFYAGAIVYLAGLLNYFIGTTLINIDSDEKVANQIALSQVYLMLFCFYLDIFLSCINNFINNDDVLYLYTLKNVGNYLSGINICKALSCFNNQMDSHIIPTFCLSVSYVFYAGFFLDLKNISDIETTNPKIFYGSIAAASCSGASVLGMFGIKYLQQKVVDINTNWPSLDAF